MLFKNNVCSHFDLILQVTEWPLFQMYSVGFPKVKKNIVVVPVIFL